MEIQIYDNRTCGQVLATYTGTASSGIYPLDPDGAGGSAAFDAYCDMELGGGGWMSTIMSVV